MWFWIVILNFFVSDLIDMYYVRLYLKLFNNVSEFTKILLFLFLETKVSAKIHRVGAWAC